MSQQSAPFKMDEMLYARHAEKWEMPNMPGFRRIQTKLGCIDADTDSSELHVKLLLRGITAIVNDQGYTPWSEVQPVGRIEIFGDEYTDGAQNRLQDRGLVLFDTNGQPLVHVCNALIGYSGSGPSLTEAIFAELGVDQEMFDRIQASYAGIRSTNTPYYVVVQSARDTEGSLRWHWSSVRKSIWD